MGLGELFKMKNYSQLSFSSRSRVGLIRCPTDNTGRQLGPRSLSHMIWTGLQTFLSHLVHDFYRETWRTSLTWLGSQSGSACGLIWQGHWSQGPEVQVSLLLFTDSSRKRLNWELSAKSWSWGEARSWCWRSSLRCKRRNDTLTKKQSQKLRDWN